MVLSDDRIVSRHPGPPCPTGPDGTLKPSLAVNQLNEPVVQGEVVQQPVPTVAAPYAAPYHPGGVPPASFNAIPPPGGAPGGRWTTEKYMGPFSWGIGLFTCCCLCFMCCPCDERQVYHEVSGRKLLQSGGPSGRNAASVRLSSAYERSGRERHRHAITAWGPPHHRPAHTQAIQRDVLNAHAKRTRVT